MVETFYKDRIFEITEAIVLDYLKSKKQKPSEIICVDLEGITREYYGFDLLHETIAEDDSDIIGFLADGVRSLTVRRDGKKQAVVFPKNTIVLDKYLQQNTNSILRRFTLGHELGHMIYSQMESIPVKSSYYRYYDTEKSYSFEQNKKQMHILESQANNFGCALQMPGFLLKNTLRRVMGKDYFTLYGEQQMLRDDAIRLNEMASAIGVSVQMLLVQLKLRKMIEYQPVEEYMRIVGLKGGERDVCGNASEI